MKRDLSGEYRRVADLSIRADSDDVIALSFSSEAAIDRGTHFEILSHDPQHCDLSRLASGTHPLLWNHDPGSVLGVVLRAFIGSDKKGRAIARLSKSSFAREKLADIKAGILSCASVGYKLLREVSSETKDGREYVTFAWLPFEASVVSVPADVGCGIGRSAADERLQHRIQIMSDYNESMTPEQKRVSEIQAISKNMKDRIPGCAEACQRAIADGTKVADLQDRLFALMPDVIPVSRATINIPESLSKRYSISRAILGASENRLDGLERELSQECARTSRKDPQGFYIPHAILTRANNAVGTPTLGGNVVATELAAGSFIELLRNRAWVAKLGARMLDGLTGNIVIPRGLAAAVAYWVGEAVSTTQSNTGFDQLTLTPHAVTGYECYSKQLLIQSNPSIDALIRDDMIISLALALDSAALNVAPTAIGGASAPTSIRGTTGVATVTNSAAGALPTFEKILELEAAVAAGNADGASCAYLTNSAVRKVLKSAVKSTVQGAAGFIWENQLSDGSATCNGYRAAVTNQLGDAETFGTLTTVCSAIYFGNWNDLIIGSWGSGLDVVCDPYSAAATREIKLYVSQWVDLGVRHPASFSFLPDALTA